MNRIYRGADVDYVLTIVDDTGAALDVTGLSIAAVFRYSESQINLNDGYSTGSGFPGVISIVDAAEGIVKLEIERTHTVTAKEGILDLHVVVDKGGVSGPANHCKYILESEAEIVAHALPNVTSF